MSFPTPGLASTVSSTPLTMSTELLPSPLVFPQLQPWGRDVHAPKFPESTADTVMVEVLVAVCCGEDESFAVSVTVKA